MFSCIGGSFPISDSASLAFVSSILLAGITTFSSAMNLIGFFPDARMSSFAHSEELMIPVGASRLKMSARRLISDSLETPRNVSGESDTRSAHFSCLFVMTDGTCSPSSMTYVHCSVVQYFCMNPSQVSPTRPSDREKRLTYHEMRRLVDSTRADTAVATRSRADTQEL